MVASKKEVAATVSNFSREKRLKTKLEGGIRMRSLDLVGFNGFYTKRRVDLVVDPVQLECIQTY